VSTCLLLGFVEIALSFRECRGGVPGALGGYCALAGLLNPALLPSLLVLVAWSWWAGRRRVRFRSTLLLLLTLAVVYSPGRCAMQRSLTRGSPHARPLDLKYG
jgi:hypothetical protein